MPNLTPFGVSRHLLFGLPLIPLLLVGSSREGNSGRLTGTITGRVSVLERGNEPEANVSEAVVWLETVSAVPMPPETVTVNTSRKEFRPRLVVVPVGSTVEFPNSDPFDHNVFSLSEGMLFDLGSFGRGESRETTFNQPGIVRVYSNVHPQMSSVIVIRDNPFHALPMADGSYQINDVPPGTYTLNAWHERAKEQESVQVTVFADGVSEANLVLDARQYQFVQHLNKFGRPYSTARRGRRYED